VIDVHDELWDDERLLRELAEALADPGDLLPLLVRQGYEIFGWRTVEAELALASLDFDSRLVEPLEVRSQGEELRLLVFNAAPLSVELEVSRQRVTGQIVPPSRGCVVVETTAGPLVRVEADDVGFFRLPALGEGPVRLRCETGTSRLVTDWVRL